VGDLEKPKLVFFFDEAHLLFDEAPKALREKIEQVVRLIRSKGVGVYFVSQNPLDIPDEVLGQLGNRVQHALRAFTPRDQKAVKAAAETFRPNPKLDLATVILEMGVGEALVSTLDEKGIPSIVERALIYPPRTQLPPLSPEERRQVIQQSPVYGHYEKVLDRESAYEILRARAAESVQPAPSGARPQAPAQPAGGNLLGDLAKGAVGFLASREGQRIVRGVLGGLLGGSGKRRR
jgi:DNA helicase HerA-like ATPase